MTIAELMTDLESIGVRLEIAEHGSLRVSGERLPDELRPVVLEAKPTLLEVLVLRDRLERGWQLCEAARDLTERARLEGHWDRLLEQYVTLSGVEVTLERRAV